MESGPAIFTGSVFGAALVLWTAVRLRQGAPVAHGTNPAVSAAVAAFAGTAALLLAVWCFTRT
ncbi:hypothetical protein [Streptomyces fructofermentans]|uniref:hypothetical protein n=1 Tax=Streptomyces fructofermentans TaxID=152141 RepID=UPI0037B4B678